MNAHIVSTNEMERIPVRGADDAAVRWDASFASYGTYGATASSTIVYEVHPGGRLGWHTDSTEETQYIVEGSGVLHLGDGTAYPVSPGAVFVIPAEMRHDLSNTGDTTLKAVAFFSSAMFNQKFDDVMLPAKGHLLGTPNRC